MAQAYLGEKFDIHAGGLDLIFPHHENEIAQSNGAGYPFAQRWLHNAWVTTAGEKMSKSLGNTLRIYELLKRVRGIELRWYLGSAHYRSMLEYSPEALDESAVNFRRIESFLKRSAAQLGRVPDCTIAQSFAKSMDDDLAVPAALAAISDLVREGNNAATAKDLVNLSARASEVRGALAVLGCDPWDATWTRNDEGLSDVVSGLVKVLLDEREAARARKDFASADRIRDSITSLGLTIEDTPEGPRWSK
jgi:cysteinyl-tRNA synthetase